MAYIGTAQKNPLGRAAKYSDGPRSDNISLLFCVDSLVLTIRLWAHARGNGWTYSDRLGHAERLWRIPVSGVRTDCRAPACFGVHAAIGKTHIISLRKANKRE